MQKWKYKVEVIGQLKKIEKSIDLDVLGSEGWELVAAVNNNISGKLQLFFKKPIWILTFETKEWIIPIQSFLVVCG